MPRRDRENPATPAFAREESASITQTCATSTPRHPQECREEQGHARPFDGASLATSSHWSWRVGTVGGIELRIHATFVLLLGWVALSPLVRGQSVLAAWAGAALMVSVFAIVILHELGHALVARRFGIRTRDITLLPIGGVARMDRMPDEPKQEMLIALSGPAVNVVLALALAAAVALTHGSYGSLASHADDAPFLAKILWINVGLAVFNMVPAFPMDGGRVLRALLAMGMSHVRATDLAATIGRGLAVLLGFAGFFFNPMLVLIALFVWIGASQEAAGEHVRSSLRGLTVGEAMITQFRELSPTETVAFALEHALGGFQHDFPVVERGQVVGVLTRVDVLRAIASNATGQPVGDCMRRNVPVAEASEALADAVQRFDLTACPAVPVVRDGRLAGILTSERIAELFALREAAARQATAPNRLHPSSDATLVRSSPNEGGPPSGSAESAA
ncbi:MAG: site-2 protease family protein [Polyangiaceae bacterium]